MNTAVAHDNAEAEWPPLGFLDRGDDTVANMIVIGGRIRYLAREFCHGLKEVGAGDDPDKPISAQHRQTLDVVALHQLNDVFEHRILGNGPRVPRHDLRNLAAPLVNEVGCSLAGADHEPEPPATFSLSSD